MLYVCVNRNGTPASWSSSPFDEATCEAPYNTRMDQVYFKNQVLHTLPEKPNFSSVWDLTKEAWVGDDVAAWKEVRMKRDALLASTDWTQLPDAPVDKTAWLDYRKKLRDLPETTDPLAVVWPEKP
jgi:hypothetical protein